MIGASISRWTMTYFAMALAWLLIAMVLMVAGNGYPAADLAAPDTLVLVHTVCIGWLSLAMCGALFQFVPVLVAKPLYSENWALPALVLLTAGLVSLLAGFLALGGRLPSSLWLLPLGAVLLVTGFGLVVVDLGLTALLGRRGRPVSSSSAWRRFVRPSPSVSSSRLRLRGGRIGGGRSSDRRHPAACDSRSRRLADVDRHGRQLPIAVDVHAVSGRGRSAEPRDSSAAGALAIAVTVVGGILAIGLASGLSVVLSIAAVFGLASAALYGRDIAAIFRSRKRRQLELNMRMATLSFASLAGTALLGIALVSTDAFAAHVGAFAFLAVFGWLSGLVLAKLYKIVAFLTWLETYGPVMGRAPTPRVQDLVAEGRARSGSSSTTWPCGPGH